MAGKFDLKTSYRDYTSMSYILFVNEKFFYVILKHSNIIFLSFNRFLILSINFIWSKQSYTMSYVWIKKNTVCEIKHSLTNYIYNYIVWTIRNAISIVSCCVDSIC